MNTRIALLALAASTFLLVACGGGGQRNVPEATIAQESSAVFGDFTVFFNAISTDEVPPDVAQSIGVVRAKNRALLNVSVRNNVDNTPAEADVQVSAENLTGQLKKMTMRKVEQGDAIYYLGEVSVANRETLIFNISATPKGSEDTFEVRTQRVYHTR
ncbi:MAG: DUF4426 domain-containing protein [Pseudomonadota bacterium]